MLLQKWRPSRWCNKKPTPRSAAAAAAAAAAGTVGAGVANVVEDIEQSTKGDENVKKRAGVDDDVRAAKRAEKSIRI